jgi:hypothetical protein
LQDNTSAIATIRSSGALARPPTKDQAKATLSSPRAGAIRS